MGVTTLNTHNGQPLATVLIPPKSTLEVAKALLILLIGSATHA